MGYQVVGFFGWFVFNDKGKAALEEVAQRGGWCPISRDRETFRAVFTHTYIIFSLLPLFPCFLTRQLSPSQFFCIFLMFLFNLLLTSLALAFPLRKKVILMYNKKQNLIRKQLFYSLAKIICTFCCIRSPAMPKVAESASSNSPENCCRTGIARTFGC